MMNLDLVRLLLRKIPNAFLVFFQHNNIITAIILSLSLSLC